MPGIEVDVLKEMKRVTNERGQIIVSVFSENAKPTQIENYTRIGLKNVRDDGIAVHTDEGFYSRRFTKENLQSYFEAIGLTCTIIKICPINYIAIAEVYD
jgi:ubiquinone/menaquinone biosynthesis C-methylase UbiE